MGGLSRRHRPARASGAQDGPRDDTASVLLLRVASGDEEAFAALYDAVSPAVYGTIKRIVRNSTHTDEVVQELFVDVWRTAGRYDPARGAGTTWILVLAHRRAVDRVRSEESHRRRVDRMREAQDVSVGSPADQVIDDIDRARVRKALAGLTPAQRQSVELAFYGGHTHAEISTLLDLPLGTVKTRIRDGLIRLRDALGEGE